MQLDHEFTVPVPAAQAWPVLLDVERIGPCMPGATITKVDGRDFEGKVKVKVGPITVTYAGLATFTDVDDEQRRAVIVAKGKEARGSGTANATITAQLHDQGDATRVTVHTDLAITGRPAQFGRGVMADVGAKLLGRFAECLSEQLAGGDAPATESAGSSGSTAEPAGDSGADEAIAGAAHEAVARTSAAVPGAGADEAIAGAADEAVARAGAAAPGAGVAGGTASGGTASATPAGEAPTASAGPKPAAVGQRAQPREAEAIDLLEAAGGPILKRLAPIAALVLLALLISALRRHRRD